MEVVAASRDAAVGPGDHRRAEPDGRPLVEEAWLDSLSSSGSAATMPFSEPPDADPRDDDPRDDDPPVDPILRRPMPEDLASRWTRSRDEAPPKETFEQLVRDLLAPMADDPEPPIAASEDDR